MGVYGLGLGGHDVYDAVDSALLMGGYLMGKGFRG